MDASRTMPYALLLMVALTGHAKAAGFDCRKASTDVEKAICAAPDVGVLDAELSRKFAAGLKTHAAPEWREEQRRWLHDIRDRCADATCLRLAYESRLDQLAHRDDPAPVDATVYGTYVTPTEVGYFDPDAQDWKTGESQDCLSILPSATDGEAQFQITSLQTNGHTCEIGDKARRTDSGLEFLEAAPEDEPWNGCRLRLVVNQGVIEVEAEGCHGYCGMRAHLDGLTFPRALKISGRSSCFTED